VSGKIKGFFKAISPESIADGSRAKAGVTCPPAAERIQQLLEEEGL